MHRAKDNDVKNRWFSFINITALLGHRTHDAQYQILYVIYIVTIYCDKESLQKNKKKLKYILSRPTLPTYLYPLVWTLFSLDKCFSAFPSYLFDKFGHFRSKVSS